MTRTIAIATPTGNVGNKILSHLFRSAQDHDIEVVLLARKPRAVAGWARRGVRIEAGHLEDPNFLLNATRGVDALYWATPNSFAPGLTMRAGYRKFAMSAARAITANKIAHTVHLSGFAHVDDGGGEHSLFAALADSEAILGTAVEQLQLAYPGATYGITHLRAGFMFENFLGQLESIRDKGRIYLPVDRKRQIPMVASRDVAKIVAETVLGGVPRGRVFRGAFGPMDVSFAEVASALSTGLGREIRVIRLPRAVVRYRMVQLGRDPRTVDAFMFSFAAISKGAVTAEPPRDGSSTTPTSLATWAAEELKPLVEGADGVACPVRVQYEAPAIETAQPTTGAATTTA